MYMVETVSDIAKVRQEMDDLRVRIEELEQEENECKSSVLNLMWLK